MTRGLGLAWLALLLWAVWLAGVGGWAAASGLGPWTPDTGLVLLVVLTGRLGPRRAVVAALVVAAARSAVGVDPPVAVFAGYLGVVLVQAAASELVDLSDLLMLALYAAIAAIVLSWWFALVHALRHTGVALPTGIDGRAAAAAGVLALGAGGLLARLPGLRPLWRRAR